MPDAFEIAYPLSPSLSPQEIRARANSSGKRKPVVTFLSGNVTVEIPDKSLAGVDKPLSKSDKEIELDSFAESLATMQSQWVDRRELQHRFEYFSKKYIFINKSDSYITFILQIMIIDTYLLFSISIHINKTRADFSKFVFS